MAETCADIDTLLMDSRYRYFCVFTGAIFSCYGGKAGLGVADRRLWLHRTFRLGVYGRNASPMALAVMAAEDQKFPEHWGFDVDAIQSVLDRDKEGGKMRGASTLSQQTAKNLFLWDGRNWIRKGLEAGLTVGIETVWTKRRILTVYLNIVEFGDGVFGVEQAAQHFFHKPASKLTASQAALLAAVLPNPHLFKVNAPSAYVMRRQQWILRQMSQLGGESFLREHKLN